MNFFGTQLKKKICWGPGCLDAIICLLLIGSILLVYWQVRGHDFINYDDPEYIIENPHVRAGLTPESIRWAFTAVHASNWHPLTWLSHMLDVDLFGMNPGMHHLVGLFFHGASTLVLFIVFRKMTGDLWPSAFTAALFALHPLHVESVAWAAERKDLLSAFFGFVVLWRYTLYVSEPVFKNYWPVLLYFSLGLLAKPMLVTLPFVLLLLDYWPLGRFDECTRQSTQTSNDGASPAGLIIEKMPFFILSAAVSAATFLVQQSSVAVMRIEVLPIKVRLTHAVIAYAAYVRKMVWPTDLGIFYPHPGMPTWGEVAGAGLFFGVMTLTAVRVRRRHPYFIVGWLWYLGTLVPVIGLVQVGLQGMADRYTYVPMIGIFIILSWGVPTLTMRWAPKKSLLALPAVFVILVLMMISREQLTYWKDSLSLYQHTLRVTRGNYIVHNNLGIALADRNRTEEAAAHFLEALRIKPDHERALVNLANILTARGKVDEAVSLYRRALRIDAKSVEAHTNLAVTLAGQGRTEEAVSHFLEALRINPGYENAHYNFGNLLADLGKKTEAVTHYKLSLKINPRLARAHNNLAIELALQGKTGEAIGHYVSALRIKPDFEEAHNNLGIALVRIGRIEEGAGHFKEALRLNPDFSEARKNLEKVGGLKR